LYCRFLDLRSEALVLVALALIGGDCLPSLQNED
jgi:hypothetical protein